MLRALNGEAKKHGTQPTIRFQLHQTSFNIPYNEGEMFDHDINA